MEAAFCVGGPDLEEKEEYFMSLNGIRKIIKRQKYIWILLFDDMESAKAAQWQMELNGMKSPEEKGSNEG